MTKVRPEDCATRHVRDRGLINFAEESAVEVIDHSSNAPKTTTMSKAELKAFMVNFLVLTALLNAR